MKLFFLFLFCLQGALAVEDDEPYMIFNYFTIWGLGILIAGLIVVVIATAVAVCKDFRGNRHLSSTDDNLPKPIWEGKKRKSKTAPADPRSREGEPLVSKKDEEMQSTQAPSSSAADVVGVSDMFYDHMHVSLKHDKVLDQEEKQKRIIEAIYIASGRELPEAMRPKESIMKSSPIIPKPKIDSLPPIPETSPMPVSNSTSTLARSASHASSRSPKSGKVEKPKVEEKKKSSDEVVKEKKAETKAEEVKDKDTEKTEDKGEEIAVTTDGKLVDKEPDCKEGISVGEITGAKEEVVQPLEEKAVSSAMPSQAVSEETFSVLSGEKIVDKPAADTKKKEAQAKDQKAPKDGLPEQKKPDVIEKKEKEEKMTPKPSKEGKKADPKPPDEEKKPTSEK